MNREAVVRELVKIAKSLVSVERLSFLSWYDNAELERLSQIAEKDRTPAEERRFRQLHKKWLEEDEDSVGHNREAAIAEKFANWWLNDGDILYSIVRGVAHFYQVIFSGDDYYTEVREIGIRIMGEDTVGPVKGRFIGPVMRVPVGSGGEIRIGATQYAMPWDGHPVLVGESYRMVAMNKIASDILKIAEEIMAKQTWEECISDAKKNPKVKDPEKLCGWLKSHGPNA